MEKGLHRLASMAARVGDLASPERTERAIRIFRRPRGVFRRSRGGWAAIRIDAIGARTVTFGVLDLLSNLMTAPLLVSAALAGNRGINGVGVIPAEKAYDPGQFFEKLASRGVRVARLAR